MAELEQEIPRESVFHPDNIGPVSLLILLQIKDYLAVIASSVNHDGTDQVESLHDEGRFLCPPPFASYPEDSGVHDDGWDDLAVTEKQVR